MLASAVFIVTRPGPGAVSLEAFSTSPLLGEVWLIQACTTVARAEPLNVALAPPGARLAVSSWVAAGAPPVAPEGHAVVPSEVNQVGELDQAAPASRNSNGMLEPEPAVETTFMLAPVTWEGEGKPERSYRRSTLRAPVTSAPTAAVGLPQSTVLTAVGTPLTAQSVAAGAPV